MGHLLLLVGLAAAAAQAAQPTPAAPTAAPPTAPTPAAEVVEGVEVLGRVPIVGDLQKGVLNYRPEFFTQVRPATAMDMVQWLPGFIFQDTRDLRGLGGAGGNVLIDGKPPTSKTDTLLSVLRRIPAEQVERVDLIVGGAPGVDMRGWPVIANVILKKSAKPRGLIGVSSYFDRHGRPSPDLLMTTSRNTGGKVVEGSLDLGRNFALAPTFGDGPWVRRDGTGAAIFTSNTRFTADGPFVIGSGLYEFPLAGGRLRINGSGRYFQVHLDDDDELTSGPGRYTFNDVQDYTQGELGLRYERALGPRTSLESQALQRLTHHSTDDDLVRPPQPSTFHENDQASESVLRATVRFKPDAKLTLETSAEAALNGVVTDSRRTVNGAEQLLPDAHVDVHERRGEAGETVSWKPSGKLSLDGALKLEASSLTGESDTRIRRDLTFLKPRALLTWSPDKESQVRLRIEHEVGQIAFSNFAAFSEYNSGQIRTGNPDLRPQRDWVVEAVLERRFWTGGDFSLTLRRQRLIDVIDVIPLFTDGGVVPGTANIGDGHETDVIGNLTLPLKRLGLNGVLLRASLTWRQSQVIDPVSGLERRLSNQSQLAGELHLAQDLPQWKLNWGVDAFYASPSVFFRPLGNETTAVWARFNLFVEYRAKSNLTLRAEVDNLPGTRVHQTIEVFSGLREASPLLYADDKRFGVGPVLFLRARRSFN